MKKFMNIPIKQFIAIRKWKKTVIITSFCILLGACQSHENELNIKNYWVSFQDKKDADKAQCLLNYIDKEALELKKYQLFDTSKDTVLVRIFGKPKGRYKKDQDKKTAEFAIMLLANDFSQVCLENKVVKVQIGQQFTQSSDYLEATSNGEIGYQKYKP